MNSQLDVIYKPGPKKEPMSEERLTQLAEESEAVGQLLAEVRALKEKLALAECKQVIDVRVGDYWWLPRNTKFNGGGVVQIARLDAERNCAYLEGGGWNPLDSFLNGWFLLGREYVPGETPLPEVDPQEYHRQPSTSGRLRPDL